MIGLTEYSVSRNVYTEEQKIRLDRLKRFLIHIHGEERGINRYLSLCRGNGQKILRFKYGKPAGDAKYQQRIKSDRVKNTLDGFISRYGEIDGPRRYYEKNSKLSVSKSALQKNGFSDEEIRKIRKNHKQKSILSRNNFIRKYGKIKGEQKYDEWVDNRYSCWSKSNVMDRYGLSAMEAIVYVADKQRRDVTFYVDKYGEEIGKAKYDSANVKKAYSNTEQYYIERYGEEIGKQKWADVKYARGKSGRLSYYIEKYGEEKGKLKYSEVIKKRTLNITRDSQIQLEFAILLYNTLPSEQQLQFAGAPITDGYWINFEKNEFGIKCCVPDIRIENIIIEFDGDYWHSLEEVVERDLQKEHLLVNMGYVIYRITEHSFKTNAELVIKNTLEFINNNWRHR